MSEQTSCGCDYNVVAEVPVSIYVTPKPGIGGGETGTGLRVWESNWFDIAASQAYHFDHNLNLEAAWKCRPMLVQRTKVAVNGWRAGEIVFPDGSNYNGATGSREYGWSISVSETGADVSFGNDVYNVRVNKAGGQGGFNKNHVECKLVIHY